MPMMQTRRRFLAALSVAGAAAMLPPRRGSAVEPPPETTTVRLEKLPVICFAPRAFLRAADLCAKAPEQAARTLVEGGFTDRYDYALQTLTEVPYDRWREYDPEDTIRFYALRLHEAGMINSSPQKIIADGTNWRFFNELRRELKA